MAVLQQQVSLHRRPPPLPHLVGSFCLLQVIPQELSPPQQFQASIYKSA